MKADLFYQHQTDKALPLIFISKAQWVSGLLELTEVERNLLTHFKGKIGDICFIHDKEGLLAKVFIGSGDDNPILAMAYAASHLPQGLYSVSKDLPPYALVVWSLAQYHFDHYKVQDILPRILCLEEKVLESVKKEAAAIFLVRDLINMPSNALGPQDLASVVSNLANEYGAEFEEWVGDDLLKANFPAIHMVGKASANAPRLLSLTWGNTTHPKVTLIGKGVCFDSGGLDIKPSTAMRLMKKDMGGAAHVIGLAKWIMTSKLPIQLRILIPAVENSLGPESFKPGDILTMRNGLTVEIDNTDAEGRLVLADACTFAGESTPELVIDFATLTGAARVAVGADIAAMFTNDDKLALELLAVSEEVGDPVWRLPLFPPYETMLESSIADLVNSSPSPFAGAITAALFLKHFISKGLSWVHFDIMAWNTSSKPGRPEGGEALGLRTVAHYLQRKYGSRV